MNYSIDLYEMSPRILQYPLRKIYFNTAYAFERWAVAQALERGILKTLDRDDLESRADVEYWEYDDAETHSLSPPVSPGGEIIQREIESRINSRPDICTVQDRTRRPFEYAINTHEPFVCELRDVTLFGPHALARTEEGELPIELKANKLTGGASFAGLFHDTLRHYGRIRTFRTVRGASTPEHDFDAATGLLTGRIGSVPAYGHWLLEVLPRLRGVKHYTKRTGIQPTLLVNPAIQEWQEKLLRYVGFDEHEWQVWSGSTAAVDRYVLPTWKKSDWCLSDVAWVRERIEDAVPYQRHLNDFADRVYISRERMDRRQIRNRPELLDRLADLGVEAYSPETMSFAEQVALYKNADLIVGPAGSSFANAIFSDACEFVEIYPPDTFNFWNYELITLLGMEYHYVWGTKSVEQSHSNPSHRDFVADPDEIATLAEQVVDS